MKSYTNDLLLRLLTNFLITGTRVVLTVLFIEQNFELVLLLLFQCDVDLINGALIGQLAVHEAHPTGLLHDLGPVVARGLAKALVAVDDRVIHDLRVRQQKTRIRCNKDDNNIDNTVIITTNGRINIHKNCTNSGSKVSI